MDPVAIQNQKLSFTIKVTPWTTITFLMVGDRYEIFSICNYINRVGQHDNANSNHLSKRTTISLYDRSPLCNNE